MKKDTDKIPGLYVHVPFCKSKCPYCDFYSVTSLALIPAWLSGIKKEVLIYKDRFAYFDSLYLGGGTPTVISEPDLIHLVDYLFTHFSFSFIASVPLNKDAVCPSSPSPSRIISNDGYFPFGKNSLNLFS